MSMPMYYVYRVNGGPWSRRQYPREEAALTAGQAASGGRGIVDTGYVTGVTQSVQTVGTYMPLPEFAVSQDLQRWTGGYDNEIDAVAAGAGEYYTGRVRPVTVADVLFARVPLRDHALRCAPTSEAGAYLGQLPPNFWDRLTSEIHAAAAALMSRESMVIPGKIVDDIRRHRTGRD